MPDTMTALLDSGKCHDLTVYFKRPNSLQALKYTELFNSYSWSYTKPKRYINNSSNNDLFDITIPEIRKPVYLFKKKTRQALLQEWKCHLFKLEKFGT